MRSAIVLIAAFAAGAIAKPVVKRDYQTEYDVVTTYVTVTANQPAPAETTDVSTSSAAWFWSWSGYGSSDSSSAAPATSKATYVAPTSTAAPATSSAVTSKAASSAVPSSSEATSVVAASATKSAASSGNTYADHVVSHHNIHRQNHSASDVAWDDSLASIALTIAQGCVYAHDTTTGGGGYGQNIAAGAHQDNVSSVITEQFYNNEVMNFNPYYGQDTPSDMSDAVFDGYGHFTQIVWAGTTKVGCATYDCTGKGNGPNGLGNVGSDVPPYFTVCNYEPAGNYLGEFNKNVAKPAGQEVVNWNYGM